MSDCIRCHQPVRPGQFYIHAHYTPTDINDMLRQPEGEPGLWSAWRSPYLLHVDCPETPTLEAS